MRLSFSNIPKLLELGMSVLALAKAIEQAKLDGRISVVEQLGIYDQLARVLIKAGISPDDVLGKLPDQSAAFSQKLGTTTDRILSEGLNLTL